MGWSRSAQRQRNKRLSSIAAAVSAGYLFILAILAFLANSVLNQYRTATTAAKADATAFNNPESVATAIASSFIVLGAISLGVFVKNGWYSPFTSTWLVIVGICYVVLAALWIEGWIMAFSTGYSGVSQACSKLLSNQCIDNFNLLRWLSPLLELIAVTLLVWQFYELYNRYHFLKHNPDPSDNSSDDPEAKVGLLTRDQDVAPTITQAPGAVIHIYTGNTPPPPYPSSGLTTSTPLVGTDLAVGKRSASRRSRAPERSSRAGWDDLDSTSDSESDNMEFSIGAEEHKQGGKERPKRTTKKTEREEHHRRRRKIRSKRDSPSRRHAKHHAEHYADASDEEKKEKKKKKKKKGKDESDSGKKQQKEEKEKKKKKKKKKKGKDESDSGKKQQKRKEEENKHKDDDDSDSG